MDSFFGKMNSVGNLENIMGVMFGIMAAVLTLLFPSARAGFERERFFVKQVLSYFGGSAEGQGSRDEWRWNASTWPQKGQFILGFLIGGIIHLGGIIDLFGLPFIAFGMPVRVGFAVTQFVAFHLGLGPNSHAEARQPAQTLTV